MAVIIASAAIMAEIGEVIQVTVGEDTPHFHCGKDRTQALAIATGIADRHQPFGFGVVLSQLQKAIQICGMTSVIDGENRFATRGDPRGCQFGVKVESFIDNTHHEILELSAGR